MAAHNSLPGALERSERSLSSSSSVQALILSITIETRLLGILQRDRPPTFLPRPSQQTRSAGACTTFRLLSGKNLLAFTGTTILDIHEGENTWGAAASWGFRVILACFTRLLFLSFSLSLFILTHTLPFPPTVFALANVWRQGTASTSAPSAATWGQGSTRDIIDQLSHFSSSCTRTMHSTRLSTEHGSGGGGQRRVVWTNCDPPDAGGDYRRKGI